MEIKSLISEDYFVLEDEATLSEFIGKMTKLEKRSALIFRKKKYMGLIEKKRLLKSNIDTTKSKLKNFIEKTPIVNEDADLIETANLMYKSNVSYLPVEKNKTIFGVLTSLGLARAITSLPEIKNIKVEDIKLIKPKRVNLDATVSNVMSAMHQENIDHLPLFENGKLSGIITFKDLLRGYMNWSPKRDSSAKFNAGARSIVEDLPKIGALPINNFSTNDNILEINPGEKLSKAIDLMLKNGVSDLVVKDDDNYLGLLTLNNIFKKVGKLKFVKNFDVNFIGLKDIGLMPHQKYSLKKIIDQEAVKLQRKINDEIFIQLHLKKHDKGGKEKFSVHLKVEFLGKMIASNQEDWDLETAIKKAFNIAQSTAEKKFN